MGLRIPADDAPPELRLKLSLEYEQTITLELALHRKTALRRNCLRCLKAFWSAGPHNRLCLPCNQHNARFPARVVPRRGRRIMPPERDE